MRRAGACEAVTLGWLLTATWHLGWLANPAPAVEPVADLAHRTYAWWTALVVLTGAHAAGSVRFAFVRAATVPSRARACCVAFSWGVFFRATFPIHWSTRPHWCLWETPLRVFGGDLADRLVAQTAEMSLGCLAAWTSATHLDRLERPRAAAVAGRLWWPIAMAQASCWAGEIMDHKGFHFAEESLWTATFAGHCALAAGTWIAVRDRAPSTAKRSLLYLAMGCIPYLCFMAAIDVPLYYSQWQTDHNHGMAYESWGQGLRRMLRCQHVSDDWNGWQDDVLWQVSYFGVAPFGVRAMADSLAANKMRETGSLDRASECFESATR